MQAKLIDRTKLYPYPEKDEHVVRGAIVAASMSDSGRWVACITSIEDIITMPTNENEPFLASANKPFLAGHAKDIFECGSVPVVIWCADNGTAVVQDKHGKLYCEYNHFGYPRRCLIPIGLDGSGWWIDIPGVPCDSGVVGLTSKRGSRDFGGLGFVLYDNHELRGLFLDIEHGDIICRQGFSEGLKCDPEDVLFVKLPWGTSDILYIGVNRVDVCSEHEYIELFKYAITWCEC